jgi:hypothetical protein
MNEVGTLAESKHSELSDEPALEIVAFVPEHLTAFKMHMLAGSGFPKKGEGKSPTSFANNVPDIDATFLPDHAVSRDDIFRMVTEVDRPTKELCLTIFAWGGMHTANLRHLFSSDQDDWLTLSHRIRQGDYSRSEAYASFKALRAQKKCKGLGPAYFTKLIYFLMPRKKGSAPTGYIMDQWVGCAINLLAGRDLVLMDATFHYQIVRKKLVRPSVFIVSDVNGAENFEAYCRQIEAVAEQIGRTPDEAELHLMSKGGPNPDPWRKYVKDHRRVFYE